MADIIVVEHEATVESDNGVKHLERRGFNIRYCRPYLNEPLPAPDAATAGVIVTGGPQFVTDLDRFPYLREEMTFISTIMAAEIPLLGLCLGGQLIAAQLGGTIGNHDSGEIAIGYYPLHVTAAGDGWFPADFTVFACNIQGFTCPPGATLLATGDLFANQAFVHGTTTMALQFHPEITRRILDQWQKDVADNIGKPGTQSVAEQDRGFTIHNDRVTDWYHSFLDRFFSSTPVETRSPPHG